MGNNHNNSNNNNNNNNNNNHNNHDNHNNHNNLNNNNNHGQRNKLWKSIQNETNLTKKLIGTTLPWYILDFIFYGNALFQPVILSMLLLGGDTAKDIGEDNNHYWKENYH